MVGYLLPNIDRKDLRSVQRLYDLVLTDDHSRVRLEVSRDDQGQGYINANFIPVSQGYINANNRYADGTLMAASCRQARDSEKTVDTPDIPGEVHCCSDDRSRH